MKDRIFKRKIYERMLEWKRKSNGQTALLIKGARRIGKSTIAETFARQEYESYIIIDFSIADGAVKELFLHISDLNFFFLGLQSLSGVTLHKRRSVIIFDEVQLYPVARQAIKHLVKDGRYDYIETGSLLSIKKNVKNIVIPSEETRISMYPMDYEEFLWAVGKTGSYELIRYSYENSKALGDAVNREMMREFRLYMLIGGMPQAVNAYLESNDFSAVDSIKRNILELYIDDFRKIDPSGRISRLFSSIPAELSRNVMRYKVGSVIENATASRISELLMDMADSMTVNFAYHANDPNVGLALHADFNCFKMFLADTGLFVTLAFMDKDYTDTFKETDSEPGCTAGPVRSYEIDFLLSRKNKICPVEIKSSGYNSHKSLDRFLVKYSGRTMQRYLIYTKDLKKDKDIFCIPAYMSALI